MIRPYLKKLRSSLFLIKNRSKVASKRNVYVSHESKFEGFNTLHENTLFIKSQLGKFSYVSRDCTVNNAKIGRFTSIAPGVKIGLGIHPTSGITTHPLFYSPNTEPCGFSVISNEKTIESKEVNIGNDVWIGANAIILDGVSIGTGSIIGAGAVVTKNIEPYHIALGVPAKSVGKRLNDKHIELLLESRWWEVITEENIHAFTDSFNDIENFISELDKHAKENSEKGS